jgi:hypothetical protein
VKRPHIAYLHLAQGSIDERAGTLDQYCFAFFPSGRHLDWERYACPRIGYFCAEKLIDEQDDPVLSVQSQQCDTSWSAAKYPASLFVQKLQMGMLAAR